MKKCVKCHALFENENFLCPDCGFQPEIVNGFESFAPDFITDEAGFRPDAFEKLYSLEAQNFWFRSRNKMILWALDTFFPDAGNMLEIGCGTAYVLEGIAKSRPKMALSGSELFAEGLQFAARRVKDCGRLFQMDACQIPFENEFDIIGAFDVLEHIKEDEMVLDQMSAAVVGGGGVIITVPQHEWMWSETDEMAKHQRRYTAEELKAKLERTGFTCEYMTSFVSLLLPAMVLSRLKNRNKPGNKKYGSEIDELKLPGILNRMFESIMTVERGMIKSSKGTVSFPFGGSLLAVARL